MYREVNNMTTKEILTELHYAILCGDKRNQEELYEILEEKGMNREEASIKAFNIYIHNE